ncbi:hypothetical protein [Laceyella sacchari]|uniref:Spore coat protein n=1 Tax=Laceyella sacchari TaxID=37482 RepID=A0ABY5U1V7_LACSH|nr:hypothetical protein [Laceyella sacchari]UWE02550.1 hypothetical protein NYR52_10345 [Laceyella sacchari]
MTSDKKTLDQVTVGLEKMIKLKVYDLLLNSLENDKVPAKLQQLMALAEIIKPGTKDAVKQALRKEKLKSTKRKE